MTLARRLFRLVLVLGAVTATSAPALTRAQVSVGITIGLPPSPPLVVVQPGIQVVENYHEEVFFTGGWYWVHRGPYWYRARHPNARFVVVEPRHVPPGLVRLPPGQYKHYRKAEAKAERKAWKEAAKAEKHRGHGHGHGHD